MNDGPSSDAALPEACSADELRIWADLVQAHAAVARGLDDDLRAAHGLPLREFQILLWLTHDPCARMRMAALADTVQLSPSGLSRAIERLEARGLVARQQRADDRRGVDAVLTSAGAEQMRAAGETHAAATQRRFFAHLTPAERHVIGPISRRVLAANGRSCGWDRCPAAGTSPAAPTVPDDEGVNDMAAQQPSPTEVRAHHDRVIAEFRANGGAVGGQAAGVPLLLLTTTGARSGQPRTSPVTYTRDYSRYAIVAAKQGAPANPDWHHNLVANPNVTVEVGNESFRAVARVAEGDERQRLFAQMAAERPNFIEFQSRTSRQLPVIVLERILDRDTDQGAFNRDVVEEFRARGGEVGGIFAGLPVILLTTTGAKSGEPRIAPLLYGEENGNILIVASKGGSPSHPAWYRNLVANPDVTVELGTDRFPARARVTAAAERQRLFERLTGVIPRLAETQASTTRELPIVVLERVG